jgi:dipeptide/tripeptide permease
MAWIASCWKLALGLAVLVLAIAVLVYILVKHGYELKIGNKKVEVTRKETPTKSKH